MDTCLPPGRSGGSRAWKWVRPLQRHMAEHTPPQTLSSCGTGRPSPCWNSSLHRDAQKEMESEIMWLNLIETERKHTKMCLFDLEIEHFPSLMFQSLGVTDIRAQSFHKLLKIIIAQNKYSESVTAQFLPSVATKSWISSCYWCSPVKLFLT